MKRRKMKVSLNLIHLMMKMTLLQMILLQKTEDLIIMKMKTMIVILKNLQLQTLDLEVRL
jgi:hypothetical protein